jgi:plastocyanin
MDMAHHLGWNRTAAAPAEPPVAVAPEVVVAAGDLWFAPARVVIEAGTTVNLILCTVPGHASRGMRGELVVVAAPGD